MKTKRSLSILLAAGLLAAMTPGVASAVKSGECPPGWNPTPIDQILSWDTIPDETDMEMTIGNPDRSGDWYCTKVSTGRSKKLARDLGVPAATVSVVGAKIDYVLTLD